DVMHVREQNSFSRLMSPDKVFLVFRQGLNGGSSVKMTCRMQSVGLLLVPGFRVVAILGLALSVQTVPAQAMEPSASEGADRLAKIEFFEKSVRPLFLDKCVACHGEKKQWGGL